MIRLTVSFSIWLLFASVAVADAPGNFAANCAVCHGTDRLGGEGPALIPETVGRKQIDELAIIIAKGRSETAMPAFGDQLTTEQISSLVEFIKTPLAQVPDWGPEQVNASRTLNPDHSHDASIGPQRHGTILVVESADHHVTVLDGDDLTMSDRFETPIGVYGGIKKSFDGRFAYIMSRDGWVQKYDVWQRITVGRVRAGINSRNIALSQDGKWLAVANYLPHSVTILDTQTLLAAKVLPAIGGNGQTSRVSAVYSIPRRNSFITANKDIAEVHEVMALPPFEMRRIRLDEVLDDFLIPPAGLDIMGIAHDGNRGVVFSLKDGRSHKQLELGGRPHPGSALHWRDDGRMTAAITHLREGKVSVLDLQTWQIIRTIETAGPGLFLATSPQSPYIWTDVFFGPNQDAFHLIDKKSLALAKTLRPLKGVRSAHVAFTPDGDRALVSTWQREGAVVIYDAKSLVEQGRIPMRRPTGKFTIQSSQQDASN